MAWGADYCHKRGGFSRKSPLIGEIQVPYGEVKVKRPRAIRISNGMPDEPEAHQRGARGGEGAPFLDSLDPKRTGARAGARAVNASFNRARGHYLTVAMRWQEAPGAGNFRQGTGGSAPGPPPATGSPHSGRRWQGTWAARRDRANEHRMDDYYCGAAVIGDRVSRGTFALGRPLFHLQLHLTYGTP